jgi:hypothetical protein
MKRVHSHEPRTEGAMKLYENVVIGNFLYALGFAVRARRTTGTSVSVVNLLQQTPDDKRLGDLLLTFPGVVRLIEFKAEANRSAKERARHTVLKNALSAEPRLESVSRKVHWYVKTAPSEPTALTVRIVPYLDAFPDGYSQYDRLETFIQTLAQDIAGGRPVNLSAEADYLEWVRRTQGEGEFGSGGLLLAADADGSLHYAQLLDMSELRLSHREWFTRHELIYGREPERTRQRRLERSGSIER